MADPSPAPPAPYSPAPSSPAPLRLDLINSALAFLADPSVQSSPLAKRIAFLESRGLTPEEIDEAIRRSAAAALPVSRGGQYAQQGGQYQPRPQWSGNEQGRDWRDWFVMTVVGGTVGYLCVALARKYLFPALQPPSTTQLDDATDALTAKYDEVADLLKSLQEETAGVRTVLDEQDKRVDSALGDVNDAVGDLRKREKERDEEWKSIKEEVDAIKDMLPRMMEKQKDSQSQTLSELSNEVKSLKSLLLQRSSTASSSTGAPASPSLGASQTRLPSFGGPGSPLPGLANRPQGLPAWQLAGAGGSGSGSAAGKGVAVKTDEKDKDKAKEEEVTAKEGEGYKVEGA